MAAAGKSNRILRGSYANSFHKLNRAGPCRVRPATDVAQDAVSCCTSRSSLAIKGKGATRIYRHARMSVSTINVMQSVQQLSFVFGQVSDPNGLSSLGAQELDGIIVAGEE